ncbi:hypothetical protein BJ508DRAFT_331421 [Ascobolus immersus RN42]|uniref:Uncharacterized protein n=1 Tax=Ascobolus immersus RN42 TaxID=1160509 RepID=A0A3N4HUF4_ASCIM|nr:hypothetical protein BJ508DRAFT_331421 [Ascobolus immersus RN42]
MDDPATTLRLIQNRIKELECQKVLDEMHNAELERYAKAESDLRGAKAMYKEAAQMRQEFAAMESPEGPKELWAGVQKMAANLEDHAKQNYEAAKRYCDQIERVKNIVTPQAHSSSSAAARILRLRARAKALQARFDIHSARLAIDASLEYASTFEQNRNRFRETMSGLSFVNMGRSHEDLREVEMYFDIMERIMEGMRVDEIFREEQRKISEQMK